MKFKYIIFETAGSGYIPIIFPGHLDHSDMARKMGDYFKPISAGFVAVNRNDLSIICSGRSMTLNLGPGEDDEVFLQRLVSEY